MTLTDEEQLQLAETTLSKFPDWNNFSDGSKMSMRKAFSLGMNQQLLLDCQERIIELKNEILKLG